MSNELKELKQLTFTMAREIEELRKAQNRIAKGQPAQQNQNFGQVLTTLSNKLDGVAAAIDGLTDYLVELNIVKDEEVRSHTAQAYDALKGFLPLDPSVKECLEESEFSMIKFSCFDPDSKEKLFEEPHFIMYQIGVGVLPFEAKIRELQPGQTVEFITQFPENFNRKEVAGKIVSVSMTCDRWKWLPSLNAVKKEQPVPKKEDGPMRLDQEGEIQ